MSKSVRWLFNIVVLVAAATISLCTGEISVDILLEVQKALIGFAGVVVTIFGIWIAIIFPVLSGLLSKGQARADVPQLAKYDVLVESLYRACFSLTASFFVFLMLSFYSNDSTWLARAAAFFSWLAFVATASALWSAILGGEGAVVEGINDSLRRGVVRRVRSLGRVSRRRRA